MTPTTEAPPSPVPIKFRTLAPPTADAPLLHVPHPLVPEHRGVAGDTIRAGAKERPPTVSTQTGSCLKKQPSPRDRMPEPESKKPEEVGEALDENTDDRP